MLAQQTGVFFCAEPIATLTQLAEYCALPVDEVIAAAGAEDIKTGADLRWERELEREEVGWLSEFFCEDRRRQWDILTAGQ